MDGALGASGGIHQRMYDCDSRRVSARQIANGLPAAMCPVSDVPPLQGAHAMCSISCAR